MHLAREVVDFGVKHSLVLWCSVPFIWHLQLEDRQMDVVSHVFLEHLAFPQLEVARVPANNSTRGLLLRALHDLKHETTGRLCPLLVPAERVAPATVRSGCRSAATDWAVTAIRRPFAHKAAIPTAWPIWIGKLVRWATESLAHIVGVVHREGLEILVATDFLVND